MPVTFDATDDLITFGSAGGAVGGIAIVATTMTISAWVKPATAGQSSLGTFFSRDGASSSVRFTCLGPGTTSNINFQVGGATALLKRSNNDPLVYGAWQHVAVTWTGSTASTSAHVYVNAVEVTYGTSQAGNSFNVNSTGIVRIGSVSTSIAAQCFDGQITEVCVWNSVLTIAQILYLASARVKYLPLQIANANLKAYWPLDDQPDGTSADGDTFLDYTVNARTGVGNDGANNTGLTMFAEQVLSYPDSPYYVGRSVVTVTASTSKNNFGQNGFGLNRFGRDRWGTPRWYP